MENTTTNDNYANPDVLDTAKNINRTDILEYINSNSPISIWDLAKQFKINRNMLYFILRDFQFAGLIKTKLKINESNKQLRMIYYNKKEQVEK